MKKKIPVSLLLSNSFIFRKTTEIQFQKTLIDLLVLSKSILYIFLFILTYKTLLPVVWSF